MARRYMVCSVLGTKSAIRLYREMETRPGGSKMMPVPTTTQDELIQRVRSEFLEMPGLQLSVPQACRLWGLDAATCGTLMEQLVKTNFLQRTRAGGFARPQ